MAQEIADEADGEDILVVAHWDAVSGSIARLRPWAIADHVIHTGYTVQWRERQEGAIALQLCDTLAVPEVLDVSIASLQCPCALAQCVHASWSAADPPCRAADGTWGKWRLETKNGENGVHWVEAFKPIYLAGSAGKKVFSVASGIVGKVRPAVRVMASVTAMSGESQGVASDVHEETFCHWSVVGDPE